MFLGLLIAAAVGAEPPAPTAPKAAAAANASVKPVANKDNQVVCRTEPAPGSRLMVRVCGTVADRRTRALLDRQEIEHMQQDRSPGY